MKVAIFAALEEERNVLIRRWGLKGVDGVHGQWIGSLDAAEIVVYGSERLGRVPAAVATARLLGTDEDFDLIVVVGMAGGFSESGMSRGGILVPYTVADLALRKVSKGTDTVRPEPYNVSRRLARYLENQFQGKDEWVDVAISTADWPDDRRPSISIGGTVACIDAVVADDEYRAALLKAWPKLKGVEMEAGGVIHAAQEYGNVDVAVLRAVADMADPAKVDDDWRRRGMLTIATLIEAIDWQTVAKMMG